MFLLGIAITVKLLRLLDWSSNLRRVVEDASVNFDENVFLQEIYSKSK